MHTDQHPLTNRVLFEDNHLLVINKLPSEIVQGDKTGDQALVEIAKEYIFMEYQKPGKVFLGVVHRIDRPTSGLVIFARTSKALARMNEMLKSRDVSKKYWAVVKNVPAETEGRLVHFLRKNEKQNKSYVVNQDAPDAKKAELTYKVLLQADHYTLLEVELLTGRHHQIRAQFAAIGCPLKGDLKYGADRSNPGGSIHLHARELEFIHPVKKESVHLIAPVPEDTLWQFFEQKLQEK